MNKVILTGRIANNLELRETKNGIKVCDFTLAINRQVIRDGEKKTDFVNCIVWDKQAENLVKFQTKGNMIAVFGEIRTDSYEVNGNKKYKTYIVSNNIEFLEKKEEIKENKNKPYEEFGKQLEFEVKEQEEIEESEYPF